MKTMPGGMQIDRAPGDLATPELVASYQAAWILASFHPSAYLAKPIADWLFRVQRELEKRGEREPGTPPPQGGLEEAAAFRAAGLVGKGGAAGGTAGPLRINNEQKRAGASLSSLPSG